MWVRKTHDRVLSPFIFLFLILSSHHYAMNSTENHPGLNIKNQTQAQHCAINGKKVPCAGDYPPNRPGSGIS
jgi:hypothetical protein